MKYYSLLIFTFTSMFLFFSTNQNQIVVTTACKGRYVPQPIDDQVPPCFDDFVRKFNKNYSEGSLEYEYRCKIYYAHLEKLALQAQTVTWYVGVNHFSDYTEQQKEDFRKISIKDKNQKNNKLQSIPVRIGSPLGLNWVQKGAVTSIKHQGNCGSCWSFATCAYAQSRMIINQQADISIDLSQQYLVSCTPQSSCNGGFLQNSFEKAQGGIPMQENHPYRPNGASSLFICWSGSKKKVGSISEAAYDLSDKQLISLLQLGPVAISVSSVGWIDYSKGIFSCHPSSQVDHAVLLVGYTQDQWIIKNQWGEDWGENGYIRISRSPTRNCKVGTSAFYMFQNLIMKAFFALLIIYILFAA